MSFPTLEEYAAMASAAYQGAASSDAPSGWRRIHLQMVDGPHFVTGFVAEGRRHHHAVLAIRGTVMPDTSAPHRLYDLPDSAFNWVIDNIVQVGSGQATRLASWAHLKLRELLFHTRGGRDELSITGHSLGGGAAALLAARTDRVAVTFNPAPLDRSECPRSVHPRIVNFCMQNDPVFNWVTVPLGRIAVGTTYFIAAASPESNPHAVETVLSALRAANWAARSPEELLRSTAAEFIGDSYPLRVSVIESLARDADPRRVLEILQTMGAADRQRFLRSDLNRIFPLRLIPGGRGVEAEYRRRLTAACGRPHQ